MQLKGLEVRVDGESSSDLRQQKQVEGVVLNKTRMNLMADEDSNMAMSNYKEDHGALMKVLVTRKVLLPSVSQLQTIIGAGVVRLAWSSPMALGLHY